jgi:hypothetical protein
VQLKPGEPGELKIEDLRFEVFYHFIFHLAIIDAKNSGSGSLSNLRHPTADPY